MKQFLAVLLAALVVTGIYVVTAGAGQQGVSPAKFNKLSKQVTKLKKDVTKLKKDDLLTKGTLSCFTSVVPVTQYSGYTNTDPTRKTALDATATGDTADAFLLTVDSSCVQTGKAPLFRQLHLAR
jgi:outer membrane murein-binding lipoprotein Lpp